MNTSQDPASLVTAFASSGILLDANLLLLLVVGTYDRRQIEKFKRLQIFAPEDFDLLAAIVARFRRLIVTPHVLTEVSNLAGALPSAAKDACFQVFASAILEATETTISSASVASRSEFRRFGITDAVLMEIATAPTLIMTVDFPLAQYLASQSLPVINFNHLRYWNWS